MPSVPESQQLFQCSNWSQPARRSPWWLASRISPQRAATNEGQHGSWKLREAEGSWGKLREAVCAFSPTFCSGSMDPCPGQCSCHHCSQESRHQAFHLCVDCSKALQQVYALNRCLYLNILKIQRTSAHMQKLNTEKVLWVVLNTSPKEQNMSSTRAWHPHQWLSWLEYVLEYVLE